jgi:FSR family fosmidomycin resistance protein-like MFS transporter
MMKNNLSIITTYSIGHFYVDFICSFVLSLIIFQNTNNVTSIASLIVIYNILAFGTQPFFGFIIDHYKKPKIGAISGLLISTIGLIFFFNPLIATILLGIGNAIYHVGGGVVALNLEPSKAKYPGIYVAPGALGLFLGGLLGYFQIQSWIFLASGIILSAALITLIHKIPLPKIPQFKEKKINLIGIVLLLLLVSVCMRSLIGYSLNLEWKSLFILGLILTTAIASGKFFGGFLADKYGFMKVGMIGLIVAAPLLVFFQFIPIIVFIGAFCFNLVMPITLTALAEAIPNYKGFAFGLTTVSLVIGYVLFLSLKNYLVIGQIFTAIVIFINIGSLYLGLKKYNEMKT